RDERGEVRVVGLHAAQLVSARAGRRREQPLGRRVHQRSGAVRVGDDDRIGNRVDDQIQAVPFGDRLHLCPPPPPPALRDLFWGPAQVANVPENRDDAGPESRIGGGCAQQLEQQVRSVDRVDEQQLPPRRALFLDGLARERRRQQHVVHADRAAPPLAVFLG